MGRWRTPALWLAATQRPMLAAPLSWHTFPANLRACCSAPCISIPKELLSRQVFPSRRPPAASVMEQFPPPIGLLLPSHCLARNVSSSSHSTVLSERRTMLACHSIYQPELLMVYQGKVQNRPIWLDTRRRSARGAAGQTVQHDWTMPNSKISSMAAAVSN